MKNLKIKFGLFSLLAVLTVSVFLTSCEQDELDSISQQEMVQQTNSGEIDNESIEIYTLPYGYDNLSESEQNDYVQSLSEEEFQKLVESRNIIQYFISLNKTDLLKENFSYGDIADENTMKTYLSEQEVIAYSQFDTNTQIESRGCCDDWYYTSGEYTVTTCALWWCNCTVYRNRARNCSSWCVWSSEYGRKKIRDC